MSDPFLTEFWAKAPPPWNMIGPEIASTLCHIARESKGQRWRWAQQLRKAREDRGLSGHAADRAADLWEGATGMIENGSANSQHSGWAKLAAFYGITLE